MIRLRSFGESVIEVDGSRIGPGQEVLFATLLVLIMEAGRAVPRGTLLELIWGSEDAAAGRHCLRQALYKLKQWGVPFQADALSVTLPSAGLESDWAVISAARTPEAMLEAAEEIRGPFLPGYDPGRLAGFSDWVDRTRDKVNAEARRVLVGALVELRARGEWRRAEELARRCLEWDPLNEEATLVLAEAAALSGGKAKALEILERYEEEVGPRGGELKVASAVLRKRISRIAESRAAVAEPPFVGREAEMRWLWERFTLAVGGQGRVVQIVGEPGIGKTRLLTEFGRRLALERVAIVRSTCSPVDRHRPLSAFVDTIPPLLQAPGALGASSESIGYLRGMSESRPDAAYHTQSPSYVEQRIRESLCDLLDAVVSEQPLVLLFDDIHWSDDYTDKLLGELDDWASTRQLLIITSARPLVRDSHQIISAQRIQRFMTPLERKAARALISHLSEGQAKLTHSADSYHDLAGGNPLFLIQLVRHSLEHSQDDGIPSTIADALSRRLGALDLAALRTLQATALLDRHATVELLDATLGTSGFDLARSLEQLEKQGLICSTDTRIRLQHALVEQGALQLLPPITRQFMHARVATALSALAGHNSQPSLLWDCAEHWHAAGNDREAMRTLRSCASHSLQLGTPQEAAQLLTRAYALCRTDEERLSILGEQITAYRWAGDWTALEKLSAPYDKLRLATRSDPHDDIELLSIEAEFRNRLNQRTVFQRFIRCAQAHNANKQHRMAAALQALIHATNLYDGNAAKCLREGIFRDFDPVETFPLLGHHFEMIFQCTFGDLEASASHAVALAALATDHKDRVVSDRILRHCVNALWVAGKDVSAFALLEDAYRQATARKLASSRLTIALSHLDIFIPMADEASTHYWTQVAESTELLPLNPAAHATFLALQAERFIYLGELDRAAALIATSEELLPARDSSKWAFGSHALSRRLEQLNGVPDTDGYHLARLQSAFAKTQFYPDSDTIAGVLGWELIHHGREDEGRRFASAFIHLTRRDRSPISSLLKPLTVHLWGDSPVPCLHVSPYQGSDASHSSD